MTKPQPPRRKAGPARPRTDSQALKKARAAFDAAGITLAAWAKAHGFSATTVVDVLNGRRVGKYGEAHRVAVALGLKPGRVVDVALFSPAAAAAQGAAA